VVLTDVHAGALELAQRNAAANAPLLARAQLLRRADPHDHDRHPPGLLAAGRTPLASPGAGQPTAPGPPAASRSLEPGSDQGVGGKGSAACRLDTCQLDWLDFLALGGGQGRIGARAVLGAFAEQDAAGATAASSGGHGPPGAGGSSLLPPLSTAELGAAEQAGVHIAPQCSLAAAVEALAKAQRALLVAVRAGAPRACLCILHPGCLLRRGCGAMWRCAAFRVLAVFPLRQADTVYDPLLSEGFAKCAAALLSYRNTVRPRGTKQPGSSSPAGVAGQQDSVREQPVAGASGRPAQRRGSDAQHTSRDEMDEEADACLLLAVERRCVFTLRDLAATEPAFRDFMRYVALEQPGPSTVTPVASQRGEVDVAPARGGPERGGGAVEGGAEGQAPPRPLFRGRRLSVRDVPQSLSYARSEHLELFELRLLPGAVTE
jgi:hypothetical protein